MMQARSTVTGLDIGSHKICCAIGQIGPDGELALCGVSELPSEGIKNGTITSKERASNVISEVLRRVEEKAGVKPGPVHVSIAGEHIRGLNSRGAVSISMIEGEITQDEIERVVDLAKAVRIPEDQERLHVIPQHYSVDERTDISDPVGMSGERLEVEVHIVTASMSAAGDLLDCVREAGANVVEMVFSPIASAEVLLTPAERQKGAILLDIGAGTVDVALHFRNTVWHTASIPLGGRNVTSDIAYGLRLPMEAAEELKICQGSAVISRVDPSEKLALPDLGEFYQRRISRTVLAAIIEPRVEEMFGIIRRQLVKTSVYDKMEGTVVMTGGGACLNDIEALAERVFKFPARLATPKIFDDEIYYSSPYSVAVAVGLLKHGLMQRVEEEADPGFFGRMGRSFEKAFNAILNI